MVERRLCGTGGDCDAGHGIGPAAGGGSAFWIEATDLLGNAARQEWPLAGFPRGAPRPAVAGP